MRSPSKWWGLASLLALVCVVSQLSLAREGDRYSFPWITDESLYYQFTVDNQGQATLHIRGIEMHPDFPLRPEDPEDEPVPAALSPDGRRLLVYLGRPEGMNVWVINLETEKSEFVDRRTSGQDLLGEWLDSNGFRLIYSGADYSTAYHYERDGESWVLVGEEEVYPDADGKHSPEELALESRRWLALLEGDPDSAEAAEGFLETLERIGRIDASAATPDANAAFGAAYSTAHRFALEGRREFLRAIMDAAAGPYGRNAEGGEWLNEMLWEVLQRDPQATIDVLAELPEITRSHLIESCYSAPIHDGIDFESILVGLRETRVPDRLRRDAERIAVACWNSLSGGFDFDRDIGLAGVHPTNGPCLAIGAKQVPRGKVVTLVDPQAQEAMVARIAGRLDGPCITGSPVPAMVGSPHDAAYRLEILEGSVRTYNVYIATLLPPSEYLVRDGSIRADLDRERPEESFRVCVSVEGLHLTVWSGLPLQGARRWHRYHYLGIEMDAGEGACTQADYAPDPRAERFQETPETVSSVE